MFARRNRAWLWSGLLLVASWALLLFVDTNSGGSGLQDSITLGYLLGTMFGHATLAAAWTAYGPASLLWRLPLSLIWVTLLAIALGINIGLNAGPEGAHIIVGACCFGLWLALILPLCALAIGFGLRLQHADDVGAAFDPRERQFGIGQLLIVTTIVGLVLGAGRVLVTNVDPEVEYKGDTLAIIFLAVASVIVSLPLVLATLLRRLTILGVAIALAVVGLTTVLELPLLNTLHSGPGGPMIQDIVAINTFSAGIVMSVLGIVRLHGYSLSRSQAATKV